MMTREEYERRYQADVDDNRIAELITVEVLNNLHNGYTFEDVAKDEKYYSKGDIKMMKDGERTRCIDAKNDHRIGGKNGTGNFHVEAGGYSKIYGTRKKGWIDSNYDYVAVVSMEDQKIWLLSFKLLKKYYKRTDLTGGWEVKSEFWDNVKYGYIIPINKAIELGIVLVEIEYEWDDFIEEHTCTKYTNRKKLQAAVA